MIPAQLPKKIPCSFDSDSAWREWLGEVKWTDFMEAFAILGILGILEEKRSHWGEVRPWEHDESSHQPANVEDGLIHWQKIRHEEDNANREAWTASILAVATENRIEHRLMQPILSSFLRSSDNLAFNLAVVWTFVALQRHSLGGVDSFREWFHEKWSDLVIKRDVGRHGEFQMGFHLSSFIARFAVPVVKGNILLRSYSAYRFAHEFVQTMVELEPPAPGYHPACLDRLTLVAAAGLPTTSALATLLGYGCTNPKVYSVGDYKNPQESFDWILAAPPIGARVNKTTDWTVESEWKPVPVTRSEQLAFQECLAQLRPGGLACVLMPRSFCFAQGPERRIRTLCLKSYNLVSIFDIPAEEAFTNAKVQTSWIVISRPAAAGDLQNDEDSLFLDQRLFEQAAESLDSDWKWSPGAALVVGLLRIQAQLPAFGADLPPLDELATQLGVRTFRKSLEGIGLLDEYETLLAMCRAKLASTCLEPATTTALRILLGKSGWISKDRIVQNRNEWTWRPDNTQGTAYEQALKAVVERFQCVRIARLGDIAEVIPGRFVPKQCLREEAALPPDSPASRVGWIRPADLSRARPKSGDTPRIHPPRIWIETNAASKFSEKEFLQPQDLLLTPEGIIGRSSTYDPDPKSADWRGYADVRCVASNHLVIIRLREGDLPVVRETKVNLLYSVLRSGAAQEWIDQRMQGSAAPRISNADLANLPVLVPDVSKTNWENWSQEMLEFMVLLSHLGSGAALESAEHIADLPSLKDQAFLMMLDDPHWRKLEELPENATVEQFVQEVKNFVESSNKRLSLGSNEDESSIPGDWWRNALKVLTRFVQVAQVPDFSDRVSAILLFKHNESGATDSLGWVGNLSEFPETAPSLEGAMLLARVLMRARGKALREKIVTYTERQLEQILAATEITTECNPHSITLGKNRPIALSFKNDGPITLTDVEIKLGGKMGKTPYLGAGESVQLSIERSFDSLGSHPLQVVWSALRLDGKPISGEVSAVIKAVDRLEDLEQDAIGANPYVDARTLQDEEDRVFFGRKPEIARILAELHKPSASTVLLIEGNRRTGKTSLTHHFQKHHLPANWVAAYCTFQSGEGDTDHAIRSGRGVPTREVFFILAKAVIEAAVRAGTRLELEGIGTFEPDWRPTVLYRRVSSLLRPYFETGAPYEHFRIVLEQCMDALGNRRLLLVIDEFDRLQEGINSGVTSDQVPENIRHLFQTYNRLAGILTGSRKIRRLREEYWNVLFGIGDPVILRGLEPDAVRDLIIKPVEGRLTYESAAVESIAHLTAGQPRIIQTLCSRLFDMCEQRNTRIVTEAMVQEVAEEKARDYEHFKVVWSAIQSSIDQFVALTINRMAREGTHHINFGLLQDELAIQGLRLDQKRLNAVLDNLRDLEVIAERIVDSTKLYSIEIPLMSRWLVQNQDHDNARDQARDELY